MDRPAFLLKFPAKDRSIGEAVADAIVIVQVLRCPWRGMSRQIFWGSNNHKTRLAHHAHCDHIALDLLAKANASVKSFAENIPWHLDHRNIQSDAVIFREKPPQQRAHQKTCHWRLNNNAQQAGRTLGGLVKLVS